MSDAGLPELGSPVVRTFKDLEFKKIRVWDDELSCSFRPNSETYLEAKKIDCDKYNLAIYRVEGVCLREREVISNLTEDEVNMEMVKRTIAWLRVK